MSDSNKHIDELFRAKLGSYAKEPPADAWDAIRGGIGHKSRRKAAILVWRVAAGVLILVTAGYLFYSVMQTERREIAETGSGEKLAIPAGDSVSESVKIAGNEMLKDSLEVQKPATTEKKSPDKKGLSKEEKEMDVSRVTDLESIYPAVALTEIQDAAPVNIYMSDFPESMTPYMAQPDIIPEIRSVRSKRYNLQLTNEEDQIRTVKKDQWSLIAQVSPVYSYRTLESDNQAVTASLNKSESGRLSYGGGLQVGYKATERLSLYGGLMYSSIGLQVSNMVLSEPDKIFLNGGGIVERPVTKVHTYSLNNSAGVIKTDKPSEYLFNPKSEEITTQHSGNIRTDAMMFSTDNNDKIDQFFHFLEVPFMLRYKVLNGKLNLNLLGGLSTNILIGNSVYLLTNEGRQEIGDTEGIRSMNYSGNVGLGVDYDLGHNFLFILEPQLRYYLNSINENNYITNRPYSLGMFTGIRFIF